MLCAANIAYDIEVDGEPLCLLNDVYFEVPKGHFMAIVGPSGCGKTTLLKTIAGMNAETEGAFFWNGRDLSEEDFEPYEVGFVPQFSIAYDQLTVDENIESSAKLRCRFNSPEDLDQRIEQILIETGLTEIADRDVKILSGGQKRRLALAMELTSQPSLLLCDEVTSGLDPRSEEDIVKLLHQISRQNGRIVISVTHSLAQLELYDSILVLHQGYVAYHGSPRGMSHYFGVDSLEDVYPKLQERTGEQWNRSWGKRREAYYAKLEVDRQEKILQGEFVIDGEDENEKLVVDVEIEPDDKEPVSNEEIEERDDDVADDPRTPSILSQFWTLFARRWRIFFRDKTQWSLQLIMILLFPILVAMFSDKGSGQIISLSATESALSIKNDIETQQLNMKTGSAVSGIIMFQVILLGLMGSNNAAREIAGERAIVEKEKYAGMKVSSYMLSKWMFLGTLVLVQSIWMYLFVNFFWDRGGGLTHLSFLILANAAMTSVCLAISALAKTADQASLLSIYLVGFQLPLSGAVLALPTFAEWVIRPFISAYWAWSGSIYSLKSDVLGSVKNVLDTNLTEINQCYVVLGIHILVGMLVAFGASRASKWDA